MSSDRRIVELDGFRGAAVLAIVFLHYVVIPIVATPGTLLAYGQRYLMYLWMAVDGFFVLSGFLIGGILLDHKNSPNYFTVFYLRRFVRIFPPYYLLLAFWAVTVLARGRPGLDWVLLPSLPTWPYWLYIQNFWMAAAGNVGPNFLSATWSLAVEEQFYLIFPFVVRLVPSAAIVRVVVAGALIAPAVRVCMAALGPQWVLAEATLLVTRFDSLLVGVLAAVIVRSPAALARLSRRTRELAGCLAVMACLIASEPYLRYPAVLQVPWRAASIYLLTAVFFGLLLVMLHLKQLPWLASFLSSSVLTFFGRISYSVYLFHAAILGVLFSFYLGSAPRLARWYDWVVMLGAFALTVGFASLSWKYLESPLVRFGRSFEYLAENEPAPVAQL